MIDNPKYNPNCLSPSINDENRNKKIIINDEENINDYNINNINNVNVNNNINININNDINNDFNNDKNNFFNEINERNLI